MSDEANFESDPGANRTHGLRFRKEELVRGEGHSSSQTTPKDFVATRPFHNSFTTDRLVPPRHHGDGHPAQAEHFRVLARHGTGSLDRVVR